MSTYNPLAFNLFGPDPKQLAIVDTIMEKTRGKKLRWAKTKSGFVANIGSTPPNRMTIEFTNAILYSTTWQSFSVTTQDGVILKVDNSSQQVFARLGGILPDPLAAKTGELYALVTHVGEGGLERAKSVLDQL